MRSAFGCSFAKRILAPMRSVLAGAAMVLAFGSPALAESNEPAVADWRAVAPAAAAKKSDPKFQELFASWGALDAKKSEGSLTGGVPVFDGPIVSVPSRNPLDNARLTSGYGMRVHPVLGRRRSHKGIDLAAPTGTPVFATADGMVERSEYSRSYGNVIYLDHGSALETRYAHLSQRVVGDGERVTKGDLIGYVGSTGRSTGPHLHYEVRVDGKAVNPMPYMMGPSGRPGLAESDIEEDPAAMGGE